MKKEDMSSRLKKIIGEDIHSLTGAELAIFLDYEIQRCERDERGSYIGLPGRCNNADILQGRIETT